MSQNKAIVDKLLQNVSNGYFPEGHIADQLFPELIVDQYTGLIGNYGMNHIRIESDLQTGIGEAKRVTPTKRGSTTYNVESHALEGIVSERDYANVENPFDAESDETMGLTTLIVTNKEKILADKLFDTAIITQNVTLAGSDQFNDYVNSDPLARFKTAHNAILDGCGKSANAAVMSKKVFNTLKYHPAILDTLGFKYNQMGTLSEADIMKALDVQYLYIGDAAYNSAKEGQSDTLSQIWGNSILFYVKPQTAAKYQTAFGYQVKMRGSKQRGVYKYNPNNPVNATAIIVKDDYSFELVNTKAAYLIKNAIA